MTSVGFNPSSGNVLAMLDVVVDAREDGSRQQALAVAAQLLGRDAGFADFLELLAQRRLQAAEGARQAAGFCEDDVSLSWMPLTHDMGLIGFHLMMMYAAVRQHLMPTDLFVRRALLWL